MDQINDQITNEETSLLDEFQVTQPKKTWHYHALTGVLGLFICMVLAEHIMDFGKYPLRRTRWDVLLVLLGLPCIGFIFHVFSKKVSWIINSFYYLLMSIVSSYVFFETLSEHSFSWEVNRRGVLISSLAIVATVLLFSAPVRRYLNVGKVLLILMPAVTVALATALIFAMR